MRWSKEKPNPKNECVFVTATNVLNNWSYSVWMFKKIDNGDGEYMGWLTGDGEEYGDIEDLSAHLYFVLPTTTNHKELTV